MEKFRENKKGVHMVFVDLQKAYDDRVPREIICLGLEKKCVPSRYIDLVKDINDGL